MSFDLQPILKGQHVLLRPLKRDDFEDLYSVSSDPLVWEQHPHRERYQRKVFEDFFRIALDSKSAFLVLEASTGLVIGSSRYYDYDPVQKSVAIGFTFLSRNYWGRGYNEEMKRLMLTHAFQAVDQVIFHIGETNIRSQKAIAKIGARFLEQADWQLPDGEPYSEFIYQVSKAEFR
jgi:RimJ/RimL family protein N-acetyltransferase